ncbi:unnamed protein product, partial [Polarella glacialis]
ASTCLSPGQSQPLRRRSPLGQLNAGEEDRHRGIVVSSASLLFQAPAVACHEALDQCRRQLVVPQCSQWLLRVAPVTSTAKAEEILSSCSLRSHVQWKQLGRSGNQLLPAAPVVGGSAPRSAPGWQLPQAGPETFSAARSSWLFPTGSLQAALGCQKQLGVGRVPQGQHSSRWQMAMPPKVGAEVDVMLRVVLREGPNHMARHLKSLKACKPPQVSEMHRPGGCSMAAAPGVAAGKSISLAARSMSANKMLGSICSCLPTRNTAEHDLALLEASCTLAPRGCGQFPFNVQKGKVGLATQEEVLTPSAAATVRPCSVSGRAAPFTSALSSNLFQIGVLAAARERRGALAVTPAESSGAFKSSACDHFLRAPFSVQFRRSSLPNGLSMTGAVRFGEERARQDCQSVVPCRLGLHARWIAHTMDDKQASSPPSQRHELHSRLWQARIFGWQRVQGFDATQRILVDSSMMARHGCCMVGHLIGYFGQPQAARTQSQGRAAAASPVVAASTHAASAKSLSPRDKLGLRSQMPLGCSLPMHDAAEHDLALLEVSSSLVSTGSGGFRGCYGAFNVRKGRACLATQEAPNEGAATITKGCSFSARSMPCKSSSGFLRIGMQSSAHQMRRAVAGTPAESSRTELRACGQFLLVSSSAQFQRTWLPIDLSMTGAVRCGEERGSQDCHSLVSCRLGLHARWIAHSMDDEQSSSPPSQGRELHSRLWQARVFGVQRLRGFDATQRILVDSSMMARHGCCMVQRHRIYSGLQDKAELQMLCYTRQPQAKHTQSPGHFCALAASPVVAASTHAASAKSFSPRDNLGLRSQLPLGCCLPMHGAAEHDLALLEVNSLLVSTGRGEFRGCYGAFNVHKGRAYLATQEAPNEGAANITKRCSFSARSKPCKSGCGFLRIGTQASARQMRRAVAGTPAESSRIESRACGQFLLDSTSAQFQRTCLPTDLSMTAAVRCGAERASHNLQSLVSCRLGLHAQCVAHSKDDKQSGSAPSQGRELHSRLWQARVFGVQRLRGFDATQRILVDSSMMARHGCCMVQRHRIYNGTSEHAASKVRTPVVAASTHAASAKSFSPRDNLGLRSQMPLGCCLPMHDAAEHDLALLEVNSSLVSTGRGEFRGCYGAFNVRKGRACLATQETPNGGAANITKRCSFSARSMPCKSGCGFLWIGTQASAGQVRRAVGGTPAESTLAVSMEITHRSRTVLSACGHFLQVQFLRELDPSCRAATDSVSPVQSGMPLAQFLGLHAPCGAIQEAEKRSSLAHLQMPCSDRRHIATKTGQQKMCGASWCFPRRVVLHFGPSATPVRRELSSHCAGSCASLGLVSARPHLKPLLLPIGASRIQQPTDKKMRAAFCKLTSKLSASSLEDLGLMELPSAHKKVWPNLAGAISSPMPSPSQPVPTLQCLCAQISKEVASKLQLQSGAVMLPVCGVPCWGSACQQLASKNTWQCISIVVAPALQHAWPATCRDVRFLEFLCGAVPRKPALPLLFFGVAHPIRAGQAADILERRLALACRPGQQAGQSQPLRRRSPLGQLNAGEEGRHRGIVVSSASLLFQAPAIAGTSEASASWHKLAQQQQRNQFA